MNALFAHHVEPHHYPILVCVFAAGFFVGWQVLARIMSRPRPAAPRELQ